MTDHRVENIKAAVDMAEAWRSAGTHSWFRGQSRLWPIATSLGRRQGDQEAVAHAHSRIRHFSEWLDSVPELQHLLKEEHVHGFFAILQHYGVPTHYADFTVNPKVAGFFAATGLSAEPGEDGCIIALNPDEWVETLRSVAEVRHWPSDCWPEKIVVDVPNLWRLQAQSGHFVYLPIENAEGYMPVDRIIFRHDGSKFELSEEEIYPSSKSPLEERLDEFFTEELMQDNQRRLRELARLWSSEGRGAWLDLDPHTPSKWLRPGTGAHASWRIVPEGWLSYVHEDFHQTHSEIASELLLNPAVPMGQLGQLQAAVLHFINGHPGVRRNTVEWKVRTTAASTPRGWVDFVERAARRVWDGVRRLPFTDHQVSTAVAMTVILACVDLSERPSYSGRSFSALLSPSLHMELANDRRVTSRAAMAEATYELALRPDIVDILVSDLRDRPRQQLRQVLTPPFLFHFDSLVEAFARELIPTQVLIQAHDLAVFFSPARTPIIGAA